MNASPARDMGTLANRSTVFKYVVLITLSMGNFFFTLDGGMVSIGFPVIAEAFGTGPSLVVWVQSAFWLTSVALVMTTAWFADVFGRKRMYIAGFTIYAFCLALPFFSPDLSTLIAIRAVQAIGGAMSLASGMALATAAFPSDQRGKVVGIMSAPVGLGLGLGPWFGGILLDLFDWRALFWSRSLPTALLVVVTLFIVPSDRRSPGRVQLDYLGPFVLAGIAASLLLAINFAGRGGIDQPFVWVMAGLVPFLSVLLFMVERRVPRPVLDMALFKNRVFSVATASLIFHFIPQGFIIFMGAFFLLDGVGLSAAKAGLLLAAFQAFRVFIAPAIGMLSDKIGTRWPTIAGMAVMGMGFLFLSFLGVDSSLWLIGIGLGVAGIGSSIFETPNTSDIMGSVPRERLSAATASFTIGRQVSLSLGITLGGAIYVLRETAWQGRLAADGLTGSALATGAVGGAFADAMLVAAVISLLGVVVTSMRGRKLAGV